MMAEERVERDSEREVRYVSVTERVASMKKAGYDNANIAHQLGISESTVRYLLTGDGS